MSGVDTVDYHGYVKCGATGIITGIGNVIPKEILHFVSGGQNFQRLASSRARWRA